MNDHIHIVRRLDFTDMGRVEQTYAEHHEIPRTLLRHIKKSAEVAKAITLTQLAQQRILARATS